MVVQEANHQTVEVLAVQAAQAVLHLTEADQVAHPQAWETAHHQAKDQEAPEALPQDSDQAVQADQADQVDRAVLPQA